MLRVAVACALVAVCFAQTPTRPVIPETFSAMGGLEYHDIRGTFFGDFILDRDQAKNMAVENATYMVMGIAEHYEYLERFDTGDRYTIRRNGTGEEHCQLEKVQGNLPMYWDWITKAIYFGKVEFHEVMYDAWVYDISGVNFGLLVEPASRNIPRLYVRRVGPVMVIFDFRKFDTSEPSAKDFDVPGACTSAGYRVPFSHLKPSM